MHQFDPYNVMLTLLMAPGMTCLVFIRRADVSLIHRLPNLLRLKRNLRVFFVTFESHDSIMRRNVVPVFRQAGLVVLHADVLVNCTPESLRLLCEFMMQQMQKSMPWSLMLPGSLTNQLDKWSLGESQRMKDIASILIDYMSKGVIEMLSNDNLDPDLTGSPKSLDDYHSVCVWLQSTRLDQYRHFFFISDVPVRHTSLRAFTDCGVDVMNIPQFLRAFTGQVVPCELSSCRTSAADWTTNPHFDDALPSSATEAINR
jgi:hypothetical protein